MRNHRMTESRIRRIRARWNAFQPTRAGSFWAIVYVSAATVALGFTAGGWMTAGGAQELADRAAARARAEVVGTLCVERFLAAADAEAQLASLKGITPGFRRREFVEQGGWTTLPGATAPTPQAAELCAAALYKHNGAVAAG